MSGDDAVGAGISSSRRGLVGAIEGGGTKFVLLVGTGPSDIRRRRVIPTTTPVETLAACVAFFRETQLEQDLAAIGVGMFGPIDVNPLSATYGFITTTPKAGWSFTDVVGPLRVASGVPIGWEHDVTAALLGERRWGAAAGLDPVLFVTVGTGVGAGAYVNGAPLHGLLHPEMGHLLMPALPGDAFPGACPFHGRCLEGLVSGPAIAQRAGKPAAELPADSPIWDLVAEYLAIALMDYSLVLSPRRIVVGGGVLHQQHLLPRVRSALRRRLANYLSHPLLLDRLDDYVTPSALGDDAGALGALEVAWLAAAR
jgi:fructokinase